MSYLFEVESVFQEVNRSGK